MNQILTFLKEFHLSSNISIFAYSRKKELTAEFKSTVSPRFPTKLLQKIDFSVESGTVNVFNTSKNECISVVYLPDDKYHLIIIWCNIQEIEALGYFRDSFPSISLERLISYTKIFYFSFFHQFPKISKPTFISDSTFTINQLTKNYSNSEESKLYHNSYHTEKLMLQALQKGMVMEFRSRLADFINSGTFGQMAAGNELRNSKDLLISATTLFTRAAIKGGMHPESAYALSDRCVQRIEKLQQIDSIVDLTQDIGELFVKRVRASQKFSNSTLIFLIQDHVFKHLNETINLNHLAAEIGYTKNYLCRIFKQATGQTIIEYANEQKIREVQSQLVFSNKSITEIATMLGFSDQSYLTKLFKKHLHVTPTKFRRKYHM